MVNEVPKTTLTSGKIEFFRYMLNQKINELLGEAGKTVSEMTSSVKENYPDPNDRASLESDRNFELRIRDRERKLIIKMQEALKRMDDGVFGICDVCNGPISEKRLMARPVTTLCIDCKMKQEKMEKLKGEGPPVLLRRQARIFHPPISLFVPPPRGAKRDFFQGHVGCLSGLPSRSLPRRLSSTPSPERSPLLSPWESGSSAPSENGG